jgi:hypothetical protein
MADTGSFGNRSVALLTPLFIPPQDLYSTSFVGIGSPQAMRGIGAYGEE